MIVREKFPRYAADPAEFRADLNVESDGRPVRFGDVVAPWQAADFAALDPGWLACVGRGPPAPIMRGHLERPRCHSKTADLAMMTTWAEYCATRPVMGYAVAADRDQARLLRDAKQRLIRYNPPLSEVLEVQQYAVLNIAKTHPGYGSRLEILASDESSSYGLLADFIVCDEISVWQGDGGMWHSLVSTAAKKKNCLLTVISNAGRNKGNCWQWTIREHARTSKGWYFHSLDGPQASWLSAEALEEQRLILPGNVYKRLWLNQWVSGGDALDGADVQAAITQDGPMRGDEEVTRYVGGLDIGIHNDPAAFTVCGANYKLQRVRVASVQSWAPDRATRTVDLDAVKAAVIEAHKRFRLEKVLYDPFQCELLAQQCRRVGVKMEEFPFTGANCNRMASTILDCFRNRKIDLYDDPGLIKDLSALNIEERQWGFKLTAARQGGSHADRAIALAIALPAAVEMAGKPRKRLLVATGDDPADEQEDEQPMIIGRMQNAQRAYGLYRNRRKLNW